MKNPIKALRDSYNYPHNMIFMFVVLLFLALIVWWLWYEHAYPCVSGHYESRVHLVGRVIYYSDDFVCDCRVVRDSIN